MLENVHLFPVISKPVPPSQQQELSSFRNPARGETPKTSVEELTWHHPSWWILVPHSLSGPPGRSPGMAGNIWPVRNGIRVPGPSLCRGYHATSQHFSGRFILKTILLGSASREGKIVLSFDRQRWMRSEGRVEIWGTGLQPSWSSWREAEFRLITAELLQGLFWEIWDQDGRTETLDLPHGSQGSSFYRILAMNSWNGPFLKEPGTAPASPSILGHLSLFFPSFTKAVHYFHTRPFPCYLLAQSLCICDSKPPLQDSHFSFPPPGLFPIHVRAFPWQRGVEGCLQLLQTVCHEAFCNDKALGAAIWLNQGYTGISLLNLVALLHIEMQLSRRWLCIGSFMLKLSL